MQLSELLPRLSGVRKAGHGYVAKCPSHDDSKQSLSIAESDGRILLHCHKRCPTESIVQRLNITWRDLFDKSITEPSKESLGDSINPTSSRSNGVMYFRRSQGRIQSIYPYVDEEGRLLYENVRLHPKDFRQRRYDAAGEPVWNLEGVRRVPYRLPELMKAMEERIDIFLCEGEKDADAMAELGFVASSFKNWNEDFNQFVQGCHVIVCQDHDQPGVTQANEAARILLRSAASVKVLDMFPDRELPDKHGLDISDYIRWCVETEGADADVLKERISIAVDHTSAWKDPNGVKSSDYFLVKGGNEWMDQSKSKPSPRKLFGEFWFESELCILFADTNVGKSILAVQIADAITRGVDADESGTLKNTVPAQKVVYFDFELTAKQFEARFSEAVEGSDKYVNHYLWHANFYRAEINPDTADLGGHTKFEDFLNAALESTIESSAAKVLVVDNLTYLRDETENARNALPLMKYLKALKSKYGLSILALAHTPKRDSTKPLGRNDLQGSKMIINFCDSSFAIGESARQPGLRYLKQIKARNTEIIYHTENVLMATVGKESNFLRFSFGETAEETEHLRVLTERHREAIKEQVRELAGKGLSTRRIAAKLGISHTSVGRHLKESGTVPGITDVPEAAPA